MNKDIKFKNQAVKEVFANYPKHIKPKMFSLRQLIFDVAAATEGVGELEETLKWGEPSYLTPKSKSGTTIRIDWKQNRPDEYAMYVNCKTTLISTYKEIYGDTFTYGGNRSIIFKLDVPLARNELMDCITLALTYHKRK